MNTQLPAVLQIDIVSDVVCPWCYVGKRQLEIALERWQTENPELTPPALRWRPFQLNPELPAAGIARSDYLRHKFGVPDGGSIYDRVLAAARAVGLELKIDAIRTQPNTLKAHGLMEQAEKADVAGQGGRQTALAEALFQAYFIDGRDLSDDRVLRDIAVGVGIAEDLVDHVLTQESVTLDVAATDAELRANGVTGVPLFIIGNAAGKQLAVSGAQGSDALLEAMRRVQAA